MNTNLDRAHALELKVPPGIVLLVAALAMWLVAGLGPRLPLAGGARALLATTLLLAGITVALAGVVAFRRARTTVNPMRPDQVSQMITGGIYRLSRNPMYLGMLLVLAAWAVWLASVPAFLALPLFVLYLNRFQIVPEERLLAQRFADEYAAYSRRTRRWL